MNRLIAVTVTLLVVVLALSCLAQADSYTFTTLDDPSATTGTYAFGINNSGEVVGESQNGPEVSFIYDSGVYTSLYGAKAFSINDNGQIAGIYLERGFVESGGVFTTIDGPSAVYTNVYKINNSGQVVGDYSNGPSSSNHHGFIYSSGVFTTIDDPFATNGTAVTGINNSGQAVGTYVDSTGNHCFIYSGGIFTLINFPSFAYNADVWGINDNGQVVGQYVDANSVHHGFVDSGGVFTTIDDPSASVVAGQGTFAFDINDNGQVTGYYYDGTSYLGFLASPVPTPEPCSLLLVLGLLISFGGFNVLRKKLRPSISRV